MDPRADIEEIETTKSEKLLAFVLALFLLIGGIWAYTKIDDAARDAIDPEVRPPAAERGASRRFDRAQARLARAERNRFAARERLELRRETYRTALDARRPTRDLERLYRRAQERFERAELRRTEARRAFAAARPATDAAQRRAAEREREREEGRERLAFGSRLGFVVGSLMFGYWLLGRLRRRSSRYLPAGFAVVGCAVVLAAVMAADYLTD